MKLLRSQIKKYSNKEKAQLYQRFFKTGKGEYGEGDVFLGLTVPQQREIVKEHKSRITIPQIQKLLNSKIHEERMIGLLILIEKYKKASEKDKEIFFNFYLANTRKINNWDLVDVTSPNIVGNFLSDKKDRKILYNLAKSSNLWEKRISIISTASFIRKDQFQDTLKISEILLKDKHDLIHKAVGWMLREVGKRNQEVEEEFLKKHHKKMPRTMLRYAIEKFPESLRKKYLKGEI